MEADLETSQVREESLWEKVLAEYREHGTAIKAKDEYQLYIVGDKGDEKMRVVRWLEQRSEDDDDEEEQVDHGLSYGFGEWKDTPMEDDDPLTVRITHTVVHQKEFENLLQSGFGGPGGKKKLPTSIFSIVLDLSTPHSIMSKLNEWYKFLLTTVVDDICQHDMEYVEQLKQKECDECEKFHSKPATAVKKKAQVDADLVIVNAPADYGRQSQSYQKLGIFKQGNLGVPLIVICTKPSKLEQIAHTRHSKDPKDKLHFLNYIQTTLRKWCIEHGAALIYSDGDKESGELLKEYLLYRVSKIPMKGMKDDRGQVVKRTPVLNTENGKVFIPSFGDSLPAVAKVQTGKFAELKWSEVVPPPKQKRVSAEAAVASVPESFSKLLAEQKKNAAENNNVLGPSARVENIRRRNATLSGNTSSGSKPSLEATAETFFSNMIKTYKRKADTKKPTKPRASEPAS